jgi:hypothetical protein
MLRPIGYAAVQGHRDVVALVLASETSDPHSLRRLSYATADDRSFLGNWEPAIFEGFDYLNQQRLMELLIGAGANPNKYAFFFGDPPLVWSVAANANVTSALKTPA